MRYAAPGEQGSLITLQKNYGNFINGEFVAPVNGNYFTNTSPVNGSAAATGAASRSASRKARSRPLLSRG